MSLSVKEQIELEALINEEIKDHAREHLIGFTAYTKKDYKINAHHRIVAEYLDKYARGEIKKLILCMPPQHGKSELASRKLPAFLHGRDPDTKIGIMSYNAGLSRGFNVANKRTIASKEYKELFPETRIGAAKGEERLSNRSDFYELQEHLGYSLSVGVSGAITGKTLDHALVDDPIKGHQAAHSETQRQTVWDWYVDEVESRLHNDSQQLLTLTRWHEDDLAGRLIARDGDEWTVVVLPALFEEGNSVPEDKREIGAALWPQRHSKSRMMKIKAKAPRTFTSLYQQRPAPADGNIIPVTKIRHYHALPKGMKKYISWDMAFKDEKTCDFVAGHVWGVLGANRYLIDRVHGRYDFAMTLRMFVELYNKHLDAVAILVEDKANGPGVISMLRNEVPRIIAINPTDSKFARAQTGAISIEAGNVHFPQYSTDPWAKEVYEEMRVFPSGANDDDVDCWSQFEGYVFLGQKTVTAKRMKSTGGLL